MQIFNEARAEILIGWEKIFTQIWHILRAVKLRFIKGTQKC